MKTNTIESAFIYTGRNPELIPDVSMIPKSDGKYLLDHYCLIVVVEAVNKESNGGEKWIPNFHNGEKKWELWLWINASEKNPSGFGFSDTLCVHTRASTFVGSRLLFHSKKAMDHALKTFPELFKNTFIIQE